MEVVVENPGPLKKVWAEIEHDNGQDIVPLTLVSENPITQNNDLPFFVDENNQLVLKSDKKNQKIFEKIFEKAKAQGVIQYTYQGKWKVHSTQTKTYHTRFIAEDEKGNRDSLVLAWSDPCRIVENKLQSNCSLTNAVEGVDEADFSFEQGIIKSITLNLKQGVFFIWNPGKNIDLTNGKIVLGGGQLIQSYLYGIDEDNDGFYGLKTYSSTPGNNGFLPGFNYIKRIATSVSPGDAYLTASSYATIAASVASLPTKNFVQEKNKFNILSFLKKILKVAEARPPCDTAEIEGCYYSPPLPLPSEYLPWDSPYDATGISDDNYASVTDDTYPFDFNTQWLRLEGFNFGRRFNSS